MSRFNTGNPLGSGSPLDLDDNAKNMDVAVNAPQDTFQDRLGKSRLTWTGIVKAGSGDPAIAVDAAARAEDAADRAEDAEARAEDAADRAEDAEAGVEQNAEQIAQDAAQQAVDNVVIAVDGQVAVAENAADRAEAARDAAFVNADVYPDVATGRAAVANGEQFQVVVGDEIVRYRRDSASAQTEVARYPSAHGVNEMPTYGFVADVAGAASLSVNTVDKTVTISGRVIKGRRSIVITQPAVLAYSVPAVNQAISVSLLTGEASLTPASSTAALPADSVVLGVLLPQRGVVLGCASYTRDGIPSGGRGIGFYQTNTEALQELPEGARYWTSGASSDPRVTQVEISGGSPKVVMESATKAETRHSKILVAYSINQENPSSPELGSPVFDFDFEAGRVTINLFQVIVAGKSIIFPGTGESALSFSAVRASWIVLNISTGDLDVRVLTSSSPNLLAEEYLICGFYPQSGRVFYGDAHIGGNASFAISSSAYEYLGDFQFSNNKIVHSSIRVASRGRSILVPAQEVTLPTGRNKSLPHAVIADPRTLSLRVVPANGILPKFGLVLYYFNESDLRVDVNVPYMVNGHPSKGIGESAALSPDGAIIFDDSQPASLVVVDDSHTLDDPLPLKGSFNVSTLGSADVYSWYDQLVADFPEYVSRESLGVDASGAYPIYAYRFKQSPARSTTDANTPRIFLCSLHSEQLNFVVVHVLMREICRSWQGNPRLAALRWGAEFLVMPCANPYGMDRYQRPNFNGVDINRNFPNGWVQSEPGPSYYSGPSPASEIETQLIISSVNSFRPHVALDCHAYHGGERSFVWVVINDPTYRVSSQTGSLQTYQKAVALYPQLAGRTFNDFFNATPGEGGTYGGFGGKFFLAAGAIGGTIEFSRDSVGTVYLENEEIVVGTSALMNIVYESLKTYKLYGAPKTMPEEVPAA